MRLEQLMYVQAVVACGSMNQASQRLHLSQQAISKGIRQLEEELGILIFVRTNKGVVLTPEGERLEAFIDEQALKLEQLKEAIKEEQQMLANLGDAIPFAGVNPVTSAKGIVEIQEEIKAINVSESISAYIVSLVGETRAHPLIKMGASPRGSRALYKASKVWAAKNGRDFVTPDDVQYLARFVLPHRLLLESEAQLAGRTGETVVAELLESVPVPPAQSGIYDE